MIETATRQIFHNEIILGVSFKSVLRLNQERVVELSEQLFFTYKVLE